MANKQSASGSIYYSLLRRRCKRLYMVICQFTFVCLYLTFVAAPAEAENKQRFIVGFKSNALRAAVNEMKAKGALADQTTEAAIATVKAKSLKKFALKPVAAAGIDGYVVKVTKSKAEELAKQFSSYMFIEPDYKVKAWLAPNDPHYASNLMWGLNQANDIDIDAPEAWDISTGDNSVIVGVLDTGIDYAHGDLAANMWVNPAETAANSTDDDGNGYVDDVYGYDFHNRDSNPMDDQANTFHGTHVAGTIGAKGNNSAGVVGVAWDVKLMALKVLGGNGSGYTSNIINAVDYATNLKNVGVNIRVLNASLGGGGYSQAFYNALVRAHDAGIVFVAAAGNSARNNDSSPSYPCNYATPNMICVASVSANGTRSSFSNYGVRSVHIGAPGQSILSTQQGNRYQYLSGTSMATPHVAGAAALVLMENNSLNPSQLKNYLLATGTPMSSMRGVTSSGRMINVGSAVLAASQAAVTISGQVLTASNAPIANATIQVSYFGSTTTDSSGNYSISVPVGANYTVYVSHPQYYFTTASTSGALSGNATHNFTGTLGIVVYGRLLKKNNKAFPNRWVSVYSAGTGTRYVQTNAQGYFYAPGFRPGQKFTVDSYINASPRKKTAVVKTKNTFAGTFKQR